MTATADRIEAIRGRVSKATPGPWIDKRSGIKGKSPDYTHNIQRDDKSLLAVVYSTKNADLIAHAPADLTFLLGEVERMTKLGEAVFWFIGNHGIDEPGIQKLSDALTLALTPPADGGENE